METSTESCSLTRGTISDGECHQCERVGVTHCNREEATNEQFPRSCFRRASPTGTKVARSKGSCWRKRILYWLVGKKWPITSMIDPPETGPDAGVMLEISGGAYRVKRRVAFSVVHVWLLRESLGVNAMPAQCEGTGGEVKLRSLSSR